MRMIIKRGFASDNNATVSPEIMDAMVLANQGHTIAYGDDDYTKDAVKEFQKVFGKNIDVYFVFNGTAANTLSVQALSKSFNAVFCSELAHLYEDECGAPEKFTGCQLIDLLTEDGKIRVEQMKEYLDAIGDEHSTQPKIISITQATELGTVYTPKEIRALADFAHKNKMYLHVDGARIANAAVGLNLSLKAITKDAGVDVLSFGGTKNGMMYGEAVVFFNKKLSEDFKFIRKQGMQLASKMRFIAIQFQTLLKNNLWLKNARHANKMAQLLARELSRIPNITITQKVETNAVFAQMPLPAIPKLQKEYFFYVWYRKNSEVRLMCSHDTTEEDVMNFVSIGKKILSKYKN